MFFLMVSSLDYATTPVTTLVAIRVTVLVVGFTLRGWKSGFRNPKNRTVSCQFQFLQTPCVAPDLGPTTPRGLKISCDTNRFFITVTRGLFFSDKLDVVIYAIKSVFERVTKAARERYKSNNPTFETRTLLTSSGRIRTCVCVLDTRGCIFSRQGSKCTDLGWTVWGLEMSL